MADPTNISKAQKLLEEMNAKYGATPSSAPPVQQPVQPPAQAPKPQYGGTVNDAANLIRGRQQQIDKASGYACGGKVKAHAAGGKIKTIKGPGTSTSDSIPAKVKETGENILVSNGERILSKKQDKLLDKIAKMLGYETTDDLLASGTGRPVGPTMRDGKKAAVDGASIYDPTYDALKKIPGAVLPNTTAVYKEAGKDVGEAMNKGNYGNALGLATRGMLATGVGLADDVIGGAYRGAKQILSPVVSGVAGDTGPVPSKATAPATVQPPDLLSEATATGYGISDGPQKPSPLITGRNDKGVITADSAQSAYGNDMARSGKVFGTYDGNGVNDILARENKARGEMIDSMANANGPAGAGFAALPNNATLPDGTSVAEWNRNVGVKTQLGLDPKSRVAYEDQAAKNEIQRRGQDMDQESSMYGNDLQAQRAAGRDSVMMRGQDMTAQTELAKLAGGPFDKARAAEADQITALRGKFLDPNTSEEEKARIKEYISMRGKSGEDSKPWAHVVGGGVDEVTGQQRPQYIVTGRGDQATTASTGADIAKRGQPQQPVPAGYTVAGTSGGKRVLQDAKGNRFLEG